MFLHKRAAAIVLFLSLAVLLSGCPAPEGGSLVVHVEPEDASGAQWRVDGGAWQAGGAAVDSLAPGEHTVTFQDLTGWYAPHETTVTIVAGETASITGTYLEAHAAWPEDSATYDVEMADGAVFVGEEDLDVLVSQDLEAHEYIFDAAAAQARGLVFEDGAPLLIHGIDARRIESVREEGGTIIVETAFAPLNEIIENGEIAWDYGVEFTPRKISAVSFAGKRFPISKDDTLIDQSFTVGELTYALRLELGGPTAKVDFSVEKGIGGVAKGKFEAKGVLTRFRSRNAISIADGQVLDFAHNNDGMRGDIELALVVAASGDDFVDYKLPVPLIEFPYLVGSMPVLIKVGAQFVINASVPYDGSSRVSTSFTYDTDLGFTFNGADVEASGNIAGIHLAEGVTETGASSAISANFGLGFPRLSVAIFGNSIVPWAQTAALVGGSFTMFPACQTAEALFMGAAGIDLEFLGFPLYNGSYTFYEHKEELLRAGDCPEGKIDLFIEDGAWLLMDAD